MTDRKAESAYDYRRSHISEASADAYEHCLYGRSSYDSLIWQVEKSILFKEISLLRMPRIAYLDFACGTGRIISCLESRVDESIGLDISENMMKFARHKLKRSTLVNCDVTRTEALKGQEFQLITAFRFFLNAQEDLRQKVLQWLSEKLSNDGVLIFNVHGNVSSYYSISILLNRLARKKEKLNHLSYVGTLKMIRSANLRLERFYGVGYLPTKLYPDCALLRKCLLAVEKLLFRTKILSLFARDMIFVCSRGR